MDTMKVLVMFATELDIPANFKEGRDALHGTSVEYFFYGENGEQVQPKLCVEGTAGTRRGKGFLSPELIHKITYVPGIYDAQFEMTVDSKGKPMLKLVDLDFAGQAVINFKPEKGDK